MQKNKKTYLILGIGFIIFLLVIIVGVLTNKKSDNVSNETNTNQNQQNRVLTPTTSQSQKQPDTFKVKSTFPSNNSIGASTTGRIIIVFDYDMPEDIKNSAAITSTPSFGFVTNWDDNKTLVITPSIELKTQSKYSISIKGEKINSYVLTFTTIEYTSQEVNNQIKQQVEDDISFTESFNRFNSNNPWYKSLPIKTDNYMIVYDFTKKQFAVGLSAKVSESDKTKVIDQAVKDIRKIYPILQDDEYYVLQ